jgi:lysophospholipase L1-like esterase
VPAEAKLIAAAINGTTVSRNKFAESSMVPRVIREIVAQTASSAPLYTYNFNAAYLSNAKAAMAATSGNTADTIIAGWGTSITTGAGSGDSGTANMSAAFQYAYLAYLQKLISASYRPTYANTTTGDHSNPNAGLQSVIDYYAGPLSFSGLSGWTRGSGSLGGACLVNLANATADTYTYTPAVAADTFDIYYLRGGSGGIFTVSDASGTLATINTTTGATAYVKVTVTRAVASTAPINLLRTGAGDVYINQIMGRNSTQKSVILANYGSYGTTATIQAATVFAYSPSNAIKTVAPKLTLIEVAGNDINPAAGNRTVAQFTADVQTMITAAKASGDVILVWEALQFASYYNLTPPFKAALQQLAVSNNCIFLDWEALVAAQPGGGNSLFADGTHQLRTGYSLFANQLVYPTLQAAGVFG